MRLFALLRVQDKARGSSEPNRHAAYFRQRDFCNFLNRRPLRHLPKPRPPFA